METRLQKIRTLLKEQGLDAALISSIPNIIYVANFSAFHTEDRDGFILITQKNQYFITNALYIEAARKYVKDFEILLATRKKRYSKSLSELLAKDNIKKLGVEMTDLSALEYQIFSKLADKTEHFDIASLRITKDKKEIQTIKEACELGDKAFANILERIKPDISERELAFELDMFVRKNKAEPSFPTIIAFGENTAHPHHMPSGQKLKNNSFILMDFGVKMNNYCSDMSRTVFFGKANTEEKKVHQAVLFAQQKAIKQYNARISAADLYNAATNHTVQQGYPPIPHSLGHGIGLKVHEPPLLSPHSKEKLENGMVFSIEPGIYLPGKFGVRIEDIFAIQNDKLVRLTKSPNDLIEI